MAVADLERSRRSTPASPIPRSCGGSDICTALPGVDAAFATRSQILDYF